MSVAVHFGEGTELMEPPAQLGEEVASRRTVVQEVLDFLREREGHNLYILVGKANRWGSETIGKIVAVEQDTVQAIGPDELLFTVSWRAEGTRGFVTIVTKRFVTYAATKQYGSCFFEDCDTHETSSEIYYM